MKKNYFLGALLIANSLAFGQKTLVVNGGQFGNQSENVNLMVRDVTTGLSSVIDTIHTQSVQEILLDDHRAYVAAQDSLVMYDLVSETRMAAIKFPGLSTKSLALSANELLVGNFYGQTSSNLYVFDKNNLSSIDTIQQISKAVKSILVHNDIAYLPQNETTPNFSDTLGVILRYQLSTRTLLDSIRVPGYTGDFGTLIPMANGLGFLSINSASNTITKYLYGSVVSPQNISFGYDLSVGGRSQYSLVGDTVFVGMNGSIGAFESTTMTLIDASLVDTLATAFDFDRVNRVFYLSQTDFFSYQRGLRYDLNGQLLGSFTVGYSPEVIRMYYPASVGITESLAVEPKLSAYPNPSDGLFTLSGEVDWKSQNQILVYAQSGSLVKSMNYSNKQLDLRELAPGMYFVRVINGAEQSNLKLIIE